MQIYAFYIKQNKKVKKKIKDTQDVPTAISRWKGKFFHESLAQKMKTY